MVILLQMLAGGWGAWGRSGRHYGWVEVVFHPYTLLNNQPFIESGWNIGHQLNSTLEEGDSLVGDNNIDPLSPYGSGVSLWEDKSK